MTTKPVDVYENTEQFGKHVQYPNKIWYPNCILHLTYLPNNFFGVTGSCNLLAFLPFPVFT